MQLLIPIIVISILITYVPNTLVKFIGRMTIPYKEEFKEDAEHSLDNVEVSSKRVYRDMRNDMHFKLFAGLQTIAVSMSWSIAIFIMFLRIPANNSDQVLPYVVGALLVFNLFPIVTTILRYFSDKRNLPHADDY